MGDNYSVDLCIKFRRGGEKKAIKSLQDLIKRADETNTDYSLEKYAEQGIHTETFDDLMRIFFAGWKGQEVMIGEWRDVDGVKMLLRKDRKGFVHYRNGFSCSYGWQGVMWRMWDVIAPFCVDGTSFSMDTDEGCTEYEISKGVERKVRRRRSDD